VDSRDILLPGQPQSSEICQNVGQAPDDGWTVVKRKKGGSRKSSKSEAALQATTGWPCDSRCSTVESAHSAGPRSETHTESNASRDDSAAQTKDPPALDEESTKLDDGSSDDGWEQDWPDSTAEVRIITKKQERSHLPEKHPKRQVVPALPKDALRGSPLRGSPRTAHKTGKQTSSAPSSKAPGAQAHVAGSARTPGSASSKPVPDSWEDFWIGDSPSHKEHATAEPTSSPVRGQWSSPHVACEEALLGGAASTMSPPSRSPWSSPRDLREPSSRRSAAVFRAPKSASRSTATAGINASSFENASRPAPVLSSGRTRESASSTRRVPRSGR